MVEWSRQLVLFVLAAIFSVYWTGKQGLWDAMGGESAWDKEWKEAKQLLVKHIIQGYSIVDGVDHRGHKKLIVLTVEGKENAPPTVAAELLPIPRTFKQSSARGSRDHRSRSQNRRARLGQRSEPAREAVARLRIHAPGLQYLREIFKKGETRNLRTANYLIDVGDGQPGSKETDNQPHAENPAHHAGGRRGPRHADYRPDGPGAARPGHSERAASPPPPPPSESAPPPPPSPPPPRSDAAPQSPPPPPPPPPQTPPPPPPAPDAAAQEPAAAGAGADGGDATGAPGGPHSEL